MRFPWRRKDSKAGRVAARVDPVRFEALEPRLLLAGDLPSIMLIEADNRGLVVLTANADLNASTVNSSSVEVSTAGPDQIFGTPDDLLVPRTVEYDAASRQIRVQATIQADQRYRVRLNASIIRGADGRFLDGEFHGASSVSGDGVQGGDLIFFTRRPAEFVARFTTISGVIDVRLFQDRTPLTVQNFLNYANRGVWDNTFFHRSVPNFVIQGGGFFATPPFERIPQDPPVLNEPGISNLRGTIAMAKLGDNPNSATNQWFFNLGNNSANLDNQNGGFTVFGEVRGSAGLAVMDALAAFQRVNAAVVNGAFNELPVVDQNLVLTRPGQFTILTSDLIRITRIALLMDITNQPSMQLPQEGSVVISDPGGSDARVQVFDLDAAGITGIEGAIQVRFGRNGVISNITIRDGLPAGRIGIAVSNVSSVGSITDTRRTGQGNIAFIVSTAPVGSIRIAGSLTGFNINGFVFPGFSFDDDIDGDGESNDPLALFVPSGFVSSLRIDGDVAGDVILRGGAGSVTVGGTATRADFDLGPATGSMVAFRLGRVVDSDIRTGASISSLRAVEWLDLAGRENRIAAGSIRALQITGNRSLGLAGDFEAGLDLSTPDAAGIVLNSATIAGNVFGSVWVARGALGPVRINGSATNWTISNATTAASIQAGRVNNGNLTFAGRVGRVMVGEWQGGQLQAASIPTVTVRGDFAGTLFVTGSGFVNQVSVNSVTIQGNLVSAIVTFNNGNVRTVTIAGDMIQSELRVNNADITTIRAGVVRDSMVNASRNLLTLTASRFENASILGGTHGHIISRDGGFTGEIRPLFIGTVRINGDFAGVLNTRQAQQVTINGDARLSMFNFTATPQAGIPGFNTFTLRGALNLSDFRASGFVGTLSVGAMIDSGVYIGAPSGTVGLPTSGMGFRAGSLLESVEVRGIGGGRPAFVNSFVVADGIGMGRIMGVESNNFGRTFGVAAGSIQMFEARVGSITQRLTSTSASPPPIGDFHIHVAFMPPAGQA